MIANNDLTDSIQAQVQSALDQQQALHIYGGGSKAFYGNPIKGQPLSLTGHTGIIAYEPSELVVTVRAGTKLADLMQLLDQHGQMLAFEPPMHTENATVGGAVAAGLSGPARPWRGSVRDHVLGMKILFGENQIGSFGGQVMKNVAGYDVSRVMTGALGTLGIILEVSLKVMPKPASELTLALDMPDKDAHELCMALRASAMPLTATCYYDGCLYLRFSGNPENLDITTRQVGGERIAEPDEFWTSLRDQTHEFFMQYDRPLWRLSLPPATASINSRLEGSSLMEWGGAQRWVYSNIPVNLIRSIAEKHKGHATVYRGKVPGVNPFHPLTQELSQLQLRLKETFDPHGIFNRGRMYQDW